MSHDRSLTASFIIGIVSTLVALLWFAALVVLELFAAMVIYIYLALHSRDWFGYLIGLSRGALNFFIDQLTAIFPDSANAAYATVVGELAPKAMLLLLIGLVVGAIIRFALWFLSRFLKGIREV